MIYALVGKKFSGKDTAADVLSCAYGMQNVKFAGCLKEMLRAMLRYQGCPSERIERMLEGDLKEVPNQQYFQGRTPRYAMQTLGTEWGRDLMGKGLWVTTLQNLVEAEPEQDFVVSDMRFQNEADKIHEMGGKIIRIVRESSLSDDHPSETEQVGIEEDFSINNKDTLEDFQRDVDYIFGVEI